MSSMPSGSLKLSVRAYIAQEELIPPGTRVLAALSGGADSVCLFVLLRELSREIPFSLRAVHVHHGLRESADRDLSYCEELCAKSGIPLSVCRVDVRAALSCGGGTEETARKLRYDAFEEVCRAWEEEEDLPAGSVRIAAAHHLEDQAETVLFRLCRGSSVRGLAGMRSRAGRIIRPLLSVTRAQIEEELRARHLAWCEDETNGDPDFARNALRLQVFPVLKEKVNAASAQHMAAFAEEAALLEDFLRQETDRAMERCCPDGPGQVELKELLSCAPILRRHVLYRCLSAAAGREKDLEEAHVVSLEKLCESSGTGSLSMPGQVLVQKRYGVLYFLKEGAGMPAPDCFPESACAYRISVFPFSGQMEKVPRGMYTKWFDYDKIGTLPEFRTRREGDRIVLETDGTAKSLARFMLDEKIPAQLRGRMVLPFRGQDVLWIPGGRISAAFRIGQDTKRVLELTCVPEQRKISEGGTDSSWQKQSDN